MMLDRHPALFGSIPALCVAQFDSIQGDFSQATAAPTTYLLL